MSIGGPCLWVPSLSSPVASPLSAVTSHLSAVARHGEWVSSAPRITSPLLILPRDREATSQSTSSSAEMQRTGATAENALPTPVPIPGITAGSGSYREGEIPSREAVNQRSGGGREDLLPRMKLEIPGGGNTNHAMSQPQVGFGRSGEPMGTSQSVLEANDDHDKESTISPSDEKGEMIGDDESNRSPSLEKKKMKRFRLTHNQTRFLMSEFTRQAHPDAAHRERLSREIPGLTPRQVQVWFQNRRAKLKRLTTNDRERMLKSRALPDDFDTTKVLRTPFESKSTGPTPVASPHAYGAPNPDFASLRALRTDCFQRQNEDDYLVSPLSSASTAGTYLSSAGRSDGLPSSGMMYGRPAASASMSDLHRTIRNDYSITRSSSLSDASSHPHSFHHSMQMHNRFAPSSNPSGLPYMRQQHMEYGVPRHPGAMVAPYDQHQPFEGSVSPTESQGTPMGYEISNISSQSQGYQSQLAMSTPKDYSALGMGAQLSSHARPLSTLQSVPVSAPQDYRHYSYGNPLAPMGTMPYAQSNASAISLPPSFAPTESTSASQDQVPQNQQGLQSLRTKFGNHPFNYTSYIQQ
ncbi:hypothetical protein PMG11_01575 [Penicillium brasilianum]|uniref:Homeobox domain-containing protein n=1 Tax=Penicillium brasilianum TaxID=104259 RepID=A0A0F7TII7_PENBI|nr:hypothetical protein PMG11_01575 [Penicillium brasilianum]